MRRWYKISLLATVLARKVISLRDYDDNNPKHFRQSPELLDLQLPTNVLTKLEEFRTR